MMMFISTPRRQSLAILAGGAAIALGIFVVFGNTAAPRMEAATPSVTLLSGAEFARTFSETPGAVLLDVRTPAEFAAGHISGAVNMDYESPNFKAEVAALSPETPYFIYCRSGRRSGLSAEIMKEAGIVRVVDLAGGIVSAPQLLTTAFAATSTVSIDVGTDTPVAVSLSGLSASLSEKERQGLLQMREEEKLAHDVYVTLGTQWGTPIFSNIAGSESTHTEAVRALLVAYDIADPVGTTPVVGVFVDPAMAELYRALTARGSASLPEALAVGALVEDLDIRDLEGHLASTEKADIRTVYEQLLRGSRNHLRSFVGQITSRGGSYSPTYMSQAAFDSVLSSPKETGDGYGRGRNAR